MPGIAAVIDWEPRPPEAAERLVRRLLLGMPHRASSPPSVAGAPGCVLGLVRHEGESALGPALGSDGDLAVVADGRLDLSELRRALGAPRERTPVELLHDAYRARGADLFDGLEGDFAIIVWDARARRVIAGRDPFGQRPLYYAVRPGGLVLATEVEPLVTALSLSRVDEETVRRFLLRALPDREETFFEGIRRLPPGHVLVAEGARCSVRCYHRPPGRELARSDRRAYLEEIERRLSGAVAARLSMAGLTAVHLSGGLDSSAITAIASRVRAPSALVAVSMAYPSLDTDESPLVDQVAQRTGIELVRLDGTRLDWSPSSALLAHPIDTSIGGHPDAFAAVSARGSRVLLTGIGGDEVFFEPRVIRDLASSGRVDRLLIELYFAGRHAGLSRRSMVKNALFAVTPPSLRAIREKLRRPARAPDWFAHGARRAGPVEGRDDAPVLGSHVARATWRALHLPSLATGIEALELIGAKHGVDVRHPFLDRGLADFVLSIPARERLPSGTTKRLLRETMRAHLPETVLARKRSPTFDAAVEHHVRRHLPHVRALLDPVGFRAERFVEPVEARRMLDRLDRGEERSATWYQAWNIAMLELWLRRGELD